MTELWLQGLLFWKLHKGQLKIEHAYRKANKKLFVGDCSRQLGKTTWAVAKAVETALQNPGGKIIYATAFLTDLEKFVIPAFDFILSDCPDGLRPRFKGQKSRYEFNNGASITLVGLDRHPDGLRGNKILLIILDECGYIHRVKYIYTSVIIPATTHVKNAKIIMISTQPESPDHDFIYFCDKAEAEGGYMKLDIFQNPMLNQKQIDELAKECGGYDSTAFRREYLCERIVEEERAILPEFREASHVRDTPRPDAFKFLHKYESLDSGVRDHTALLFGYYDFERAKLVIEDEFSIKGHEVTTRNINDKTRAKEADLKYNIEALEVPTSLKLRVADNDNLILLQDLGSEFGLHFAPTDKDSLHAMVNKVRLWMRSDRIEIHPRCEKLIACIKAGVWNLQRSEFARSDKHGHYDLISALVYMVRNVNDTVNPIPIYFKKDISNTFFTKKPDGSGDVFKKAFFG